MYQHLQTDNRFSKSKIHTASLLIAVALLVFPVRSYALPSFARQFDQQCIACHTEFPILTDLGRQFKLSGYTMSAEHTDLPPLAVMLQPSFTHTQTDQTGGAAPGFKANDNFAFTQASIFYSGRLFGPYASKVFDPDVASILNKFGIFSQVTYDGIAKKWAWDNIELRYANSTNLAAKSLTYGFYANNNPTLQDPWNSTPAWTFPFSGSGLAPTPVAATLIDGGVSQQVIGAGAYAMWNNTIYVDLAGYRTLASRFQKNVGVDPDGETQITGLAPYWRVAAVKQIGPGRWEFGTFGLAADTYPGRDQSAGKDRFLDLGLDSEYQESIARHDVTMLLSYIHEHEDWNASQALGNTDNASDNLWNFKATVDYLYDKTYGAAVQYFAIDGSSDATLYAESENGSPKSDGFIFQLNYLPINKKGGPAFWPRSNVKLSLQYTLYNHFNGTTTNASDNNTFYLEAWIAF